MELVSPINRAAFPGYAKISHNVPRLQQGFLKMLAAIALVVIPAGVGVALVAEPAVHVMLGERWLQAVPAIQLLSLYGCLGGLQGNANAVYMAIGKPRLQSSMLIVFVAVLLPAVLILTPVYGHIGAAMAYMLAGLVAVPYNLLNICKCLSMPGRRLLETLWRPVVGTVFMAGVVALMLFLLPWDASWTGQMVKMVACSVTGVAVYIVVVIGTWHLVGQPDGAERWALDAVRTRLAKV
jgi:O-antigen/teichoic acid export membrane protein